MSRRRWLPLRTSPENRPEPAQLIAHQHAVWRVVKVEDLPLSDTDRDKWLDSGMPDLATWHQRPYKVDVEWVAGSQPPWAADGHKGKAGVLKVPAGASMRWDVYRDGRWPQCSCCGEPMPCRAELEDRQVTASLDRIARLELIPPGACWACAQPITTRQKSVTYPGENLDLPGGQQVHFHTRRECLRSACAYEERWIAVDLRRERILTWPRCDGILIVHGDGSSECVSGRDPLGDERTSHPECRGHLTHDHGVLRACLVHDNWLRSSGWEGSRCPRGCTPDGHPGTRTTPRPARREAPTGDLFQ